MSDAADGPTKAWLDRRALVSRVNRELELYASLQNGIPLWRAFLLCRAAGEPVPEVILHELEQMARGLVDAEGPDEALRVLKLDSNNRGGTASYQLKLARERRETMSRVDRLIALGVSKGEAYRRVAGELGKDVGAIKKAYAKWCGDAVTSRRRTKPQHQAAVRVARSVFEIGEASPPE